MTRRADARGRTEDWPFHVVVVCKKCRRTLLKYWAWRDGDREGVDGDDRWEPHDATLTSSGSGSAKFHFNCECRARPQIRYDKVAQAASAHGVVATLEI